MNRKIKSRKGMTLVEMVVTIAILTIVSGMGVGIFTATMQHYSTASVTSDEQNKATLLESYIVSNANVAKSMTDVTSIPDSHVPGTYIAMKKGTVDDENYVVQIFDYDGVTRNSLMTVENVQNVTIKFRRHQTQSSASDKDDFLYIYYEIVMKSGYTLTGTTMTNNMDLSTFTKVDTGYTIEDFVYTLGSTVNDTAIVFGK